MPAKSLKQYKMMQAIAHGGMKPPGGLTPDKAAEYVKGQSPRGLPTNAPKTIDQWDKTGSSAAPVSGSTKARAEKILGAKRKK